MKRIMIDEKIGDRKVGYFFAVEDGKYREGGWASVPGRLTEVEFLSNNKKGLQVKDPAVREQMIRRIDELRPNAKQILGVK